MITPSMRNIYGNYGTTVIHTVSIDTDYTEAKFQVDFDDGVWYYVRVTAITLYNPSTFAPQVKVFLDITESNVTGMVGRKLEIRDKSKTSSPSNFGNSAIQWLEGIRGI